MPLLYGCLDRHCGARMLVLFLISAYINAIAKIIASLPRPFEFDSSIKALRYALIGVWCAWGAPRLFVRLRLAESE